MKIAATYEQGMVGQHFGRTEEFKVMMWKMKRFWSQSS